MSVENGDFIESIEIETPAGRAWKRVESMRKYLPVVLFQGIALASEACNLTSVASFQNAAINAGLSGFFAGSVSDMAFYSGINDRNTRWLLTVATSLAGSLVTIGVSARYGVAAGGLLTFGEGLVSLGISTMALISKTEERFKKE